MDRTKTIIMHEINDALDTRNKQLFLILAKEYRIACEVEEFRLQSELTEMKQ